MFHVTQNQKTLAEPSFFTCVKKGKDCAECICPPDGKYDKVKDSVLKGKL